MDGQHQALHEQVRFGGRIRSREYEGWYGHAYTRSALYAGWTREKEREMKTTKRRRRRRKKGEDGEQKDEEQD